jgi:hypothetical protein
MDPRRLVIFDNSVLVPARWRFRAGQGPVWAFNPAIISDSGAGWVFAYRLVFRDQRRRIAICRLDENFRVIAGSLVPLSDLIHLAPSKECSEVDRAWFADPRLYRIGGRLMLYWNTGWHDSPNCQFLQELDEDSLQPRGHPKIFRREGERQTIEKNWMLFGDGPLFAVYSITGQRILQGDLGDREAIRFSEAFETEWDPGPYVREFGPLRGGAPPQLVDGGYYCFCHSVCPSPAGRRYVPAVYRFAAQPPFTPTHGPRRAVPLPNPFRLAAVYALLTPMFGEVLYPCGAAFHAGQWVVSYGITNERCAVAVLPHADIQACLRPL